MEGLKMCLPAFYRHAVFAMSLTLCALPAAASPTEKAKRIHDRLAGTPPSAAVLDKMQRAITGDPSCGIPAQIGGCTSIGAAYLAMQNPAFYSATLKSWVSPWTNRDGDKFAPLNDYSATVIGVVRDELDYRRVLYDDILYVGAQTGPVTAAYSNSDNNNYRQLEANDVDLGDSAKLVQRVQSQVTGLPPAATAGVITSRAAARAFFIDGTNRAMFRFTLKNHLCNDLEQVQDTTRPSDRIRRDISRSPGGDSRIFMNTCIGCHSGMDPLAQAFAYYNFSYTKGNEDGGQLQYTPGSVQPKYSINENHFIEGYDTPDDHWDNYWRSGPNTAIFGWSNTHLAATSAARNKNGIYGDAGAKSMGEELANSEAFAVCSVKKVFQAVCLRAPATADQSQFTAMLNSFKSTNYNLKRTFAEAAVYCSGN